MASDALFAADKLPRYWWAQLCAVPPKSELAYDRLKRAWFDQTGVRPWFRNPECEAHLVCTLFENMVLFPPGAWVPQLIEDAGATSVPKNVQSCRWSYEFEDDENLKNGRAPIADLVLCARDEQGEFVVVVEAKRRGGSLKAGDHDPDYYLGSPKFKRYTRRYMLYLIYESDRATSKAPITDPAYRGVLTWQQLGGLQVSQALLLDLPDVPRRFIAGAIQYQFCQHDIRPTILAAGYLSREPAYETMPTNKDQPGAQQIPDRRVPMWRCDWDE